LTEKEGKTMTEKGKLTIFFGYAAGVGKTYAMLEKAHEEMAKGKDIVAAYIEPHDRKETSKLLSGLEEVDKKEITYKNHSFYELDLDKTLERKPQIALVDELAHTNAPGSRHKKRYQDIEELLKAGIDVYTSLNVQHLESLHDTVEAITKIKVNERIPDHIFDQAFDVKLVDIEVEELLQRLKDGKIYKSSQVKRVLENFFTKKNLIALREIALRRCADRINLYSDKKTKAFSKEHIMVCISPSPSNPKDLKADVVVSYGDDIAYQISQYAKVSSVSKLVLGRSREKISVLRKKSLIDKISSEIPYLDIYIIPDNKASGKAHKTTVKKDFNLNFKDLVLSLLIIGLTSLFSAYLFRLGFDLTGIVLIYLLSSCAIGFLTSHPIYSLVGVFINVLLIDYLFVEPYYTLDMYSKKIPVVFAVMLIVSFLINLMQNRLKKENLLAVKRAHNLDILLQTSQRLQVSRTYQDVMEETCHSLNKLLDRAIIFYPVRYGALLDPRIYNPGKDKNIEEIYKSHSERAVAQWVYVNNKNAGATTKTLSNAHGLYYSIRKNEKVYGVVGIDLADGFDFAVHDKSLLLAILNEIALAFDSL
jgi:two-component system sensor histidine kinase KdpD